MDKWIEEFGNHYAELLRLEISKPLSENLEILHARGCPAHLAVKAAAERNNVSMERIIEVIDRLSVCDVIEATDF
jgi:hypothetical protein